MKLRVNRKFSWLRQEERVAKDVCTVVAEYQCKTDTMCKGKGNEMTEKRKEFENCRAVEDGLVWGVEECPEIKMNEKRRRLLT